MDENLKAKKKTRRGKRRRKERINEGDSGTGSIATRTRRAKHSKLGSGLANQKRIEQRCRKRLRKRLQQRGKQYGYVDPWRRIKFGPATFDKNDPESELLLCLKQVPDDQIISNKVLVQVCEYLHEKVFDDSCGTVSIAWATDIDMLTNLLIVTLN